MTPEMDCASTNSTSPGCSVKRNPIAGVNLAIARDRPVEILGNSSPTIEEKLYQRPFSGVRLWPGAALLRILSI
jgi:hypothetical protein